MSAKGLIWIGVFVGSTVGSWIGALFDHGNWFGGWSIALGAVGAFLGIWAGYKISKNL
jgi:hypothetical protein